MTEPSRFELLELDIDARLHDLWGMAAETPAWNLEHAARFMRAAYGQGYLDALREDRRGELCLQHGYAVPERAAT